MPLSPHPHPNFLTSAKYEEERRDGIASVSISAEDVSFVDAPSSFPSHNVGKKTPVTTTLGDLFKRWTSKWNHEETENHPQTQDETSTSKNRSSSSSISPQAANFDDLPDFLRPELKHHSCYDGVVVRFYAGRVFLLSVEDSEFFDNVLYEAAAHKSLDETLELYGSFVIEFGANNSKTAETPYSDAVIRGLFSDYSTLWDGVIKYSVKSKGSFERGRFVRYLTSRRLVLEVEGGVEADERFLKVLCPFETLSLEAEQIELRKSLRQALPDEEINPDDDGPKLPPYKPRTSETQSKLTTAPAAFSKSSGSGMNPKSPLLPLAFTAKQVLISLLFKSSIDPNRWSAVFKAKDLRYFDGGRPTDYFSENVQRQISHGSFDGKILSSSDVSPERCIKKGWVEMRQHFFKPYQRNNLTYNILTRHNRPSIFTLIEKRTYLSFFSLHDGPADRPYLEKDPVAISKCSRFRHFHFVNLCHELYVCLMCSWGGPLLFLTYQPVEQIRFYFGEQIAMYFAWLSFYTFFCWSAALLGLATFFYGVSRAIREPEPSLRLLTLFDNEMTPVFAFLISVWATLFLEMWKRQTNYLAHIWHVHDYERRERIRPQWKFSTKYQRKDPITDEIEYYEPRIFRFLRRLFTSLVMIAAVALNVVFIVCIIIFRAWFRSTFQGGFSSTLASLLASLASLAIVALSSPVFGYLARILTDFENYRTDTRYQAALILKNFVLAAVNNFLSVLYIAVFKSILSSENGNYVLGMFPDECELLLGNRSCMAELMLQMAVIFIGLQFLEQIKEIIYPRFIKTRRRLSRRKSVARASKEETDLKQFIMDDEKLKYTEEDLGRDYFLKVTQFGFITLFSCSFPLAPIFSLVNNMFETRVDTFKLLMDYQRPWARRTQGIGIIQTLMVAVSYVGVLTNAITIAFASSAFKREFLDRFPPESHLAVRILFIVVFEHVVFSIKVKIHVVLGS
ncbi:Anoctamin-7 [Phlyctochytrium planicorne]|nr:Anoctamin-7 [Phlyctochytrium planicorne]